MQNADVLQLKTLTLKELRELKGKVETAIRAAIRQRNERMKGNLPASAATAAASPTKIDLERERDAWMARRRAGAP